MSIRVVKEGFERGEVLFSCSQLLPLYNIGKQVRSLDHTRCSNYEGEVLGVESVSQLGSGESIR